LPSILIECGFLSSPEEEQLLISEDYQKTLCYYIFCGVVQYFGVVSGIAI
jgi:N-acetylmuramoyl-L-alanine amidase